MEEEYVATEEPTSPTPRRETSDETIARWRRNAKFRKWRKKGTPVDRQKVEQLLREGWSGAEIARSLNISPSSVSKIKHPHYEEIYMKELRKYVRNAVRAYFKEQKRKGYKLHDVYERTHLRGLDEEQLLSILDDVCGDRQLALEKAREASDWAFGADLETDDFYTDEELKRNAEEKKNWVETLRQQPEWVWDFFGCKRKKSDYSKLKVC